MTSLELAWRPSPSLGQLLEFSIAAARRLEAVPLDLGTQSESEAGSKLAEPREDDRVHSLPPERLAGPSPANNTCNCFEETKRKPFHSEGEQ